ncbi:outer membrane lipoprotein carrier protein LolA [Solihabitans fulvus]|uniref:Outer membrane lipoprotein carrier protein LolA n=1 Tax=Solihabitans fulvus TaxID=1892852 RepID=A0A5B2XM90_9PSEU|nr:outer membrane lipoprotein carrier protein LolA [Solihabitans fulvus]KAA2264011.1 outer membrane lipoprotein carrier protein LolA [Solihabitans fulvus]
MNNRKVTLAVTAAGVVAGVVGLGIVANPAGAGPAPTLPSVSAESLVQSVLTAKPAAFAGSVEVTNNLGLPALPGIPLTADGVNKARVWSDGQGRARLSLPSAQSEQVFVEDGKTVWSYDSAKKTATKSTKDAAKDGAGKTPLDQHGDRAANPVTAAADLITELRKTSNIAVDGTATVAGRPAYELVLSPKPDERTLLREVRVAVDSELRIPLRAEVLTNGTNEPAVQVAFADLTVGSQDASLFTFTPPAGTKVEDKNLTAKDRKTAEEAKDQVSPQVVGDGWDTTLVGRVPAGLLSGNATAPNGSTKHNGQNPAALLKQFGMPVSGAWGSGIKISTKVGTGLLTDDGRFAVGAVPEQVLYEAIGQVK